MVSAGESMMTDVNMADDCVMDVGAEDVAVLELCAERGGLGRYTLLNDNCRSGPRRTAGGGDFGASASEDVSVVPAHSET